VQGRVTWLGGGLDFFAHKRHKSRSVKKRGQLVLRGREGREGVGCKFPLGIIFLGISRRDGEPMPSILSLRFERSREGDVPSLNCRGSPGNPKLGFWPLASERPP